MKLPENITAWDLQDTIRVPDGYDMTSVPDLTRRNFEYLIEEHNKLVNIIEEIAAHCGFNSANND